MKKMMFIFALAALMAVFLCLATAPVRAAHPPSCAPEDEDLWRALPRTASVYKGR
jgi:hypothetical protein